MIAAALIVLREVFEAALVVGIVLAATRGVPRRGRWVAAGVGLGVVGAVLVAGAAGEIAAAFEGVGQEVLNASVLLTAAAMLGWHNLWMKAHGAELARDMRQVGERVAHGRADLSILLTVVGLAVLREGSEVVLFLYGIAAGGTRAAELAAGSALGIVGGVAIGTALYRGLVAIPTRHLFRVTGWLLLLMAAGMAAQAAGFLVQAGKLPALVEPLWNSSAWLPEDGVLGQVLHALVGYADRPSGMQVAWFAGVVLLLTLLMRLGEYGIGAATRTAVGAAVVLVALLALLVPAPAHAAYVIYSPIVEQGEFALEARGHDDIDSSPAKNTGQEHKLELEYAPTARWLTELLGTWEREPGDSLHATEVSWENVFQLTEQGQYWADLGVVAEYAHSIRAGGHDALELGLLAEKQVAGTVATLNVTAERPFVPGGRPDVSYAFRWRYRLAQAFEPGIEWHGDLGDWGEFGSLREQRHLVGPSALGAFRRADARGALRYETALLFGLTQGSPDMTLRLQLEWEF